MKNRPITLPDEIERIIKKCEVCHLAMVDENNEPYVIPMNFGYAAGEIFLHSSQNGKKVDILNNNNNVCVSFSTDHELRWQSEQVACSYGMKYRSVIAFGYVEFIDDFQKKTEALNILMSQYSQRKFKYSDPSVKDVLVFKVIVEKIEGRAYGY